MDSAPRSPFSVAVGWISSSSTLRASTRAADTFWKICSCVSIVVLLLA